MCWRPAISETDYANIRVSIYVLDLVIWTARMLTENWCYSICKMDYTNVNLGVDALQQLVQRTQRVFDICTDVHLSRIMCFQAMCVTLWSRLHNWFPFRSWNSCDVFLQHTYLFTEVVVLCLISVSRVNYRGFRFMFARLTDAYISVTNLSLSLPHHPSLTHRSFLPHPPPPNCMFSNRLFLETGHTTTCLFTKLNQWFSEWSVLPREDDIHT